MNMNIYDTYLTWIDKALELKDELALMEEREIEDAFYRNLEFGTGGLRGLIGPGTNRMNVYTVARASQGLANYILSNYPDNPKIAIAYDSRNKSEIFSKIAAEVFAANKISVYVYPELAPTPMLSYAVRYYGCAAGIVITASHNPAKYNGYKVYGPDGCQITTESAERILSEIENLDYFSDIRRVSSDEFCEKDSLIHTITDDCYNAYFDAVNRESTIYGEEIGNTGKNDEINKDLAIIYTPLNGAGLKPVTRILKENGYNNIVVVEEQTYPDGNFHTCPYPNPEIKEALSLGLEYANRMNADLLLATDPDCDRIGIAVIDGRDGREMKLLTGNEVGVLLLDYICSQRLKHSKMSDNPILIKTIVTSDMAERIACHYGLDTINVLTGFKFIGEQIGLLEAAKELDRYIFGFEESYGYLSGTYVRDKDAVNGALLICEMYAYYKSLGISLVEKLEELYKEYGYFINTLHTYEFDGPKGMLKMERIMESLRKVTSYKELFSGKGVISVEDYLGGINGLPKSNVIKFKLEDDSSIVIRPSGTEPKLKVYISACESDRASAESLSAALIKEVETLIERLGINKQ